MSDTISTLNEIRHLLQEVATNCNRCNKKTAETLSVVQDKIFEIVNKEENND